jgi:hypothetical protein
MRASEQLKRDLEFIQTYRRMAIEYMTLVAKLTGFLDVRIEGRQILTGPLSESEKNLLNLKVNELRKEISLKSAEANRISRERVNAMLFPAIVINARTYHEETFQSVPDHFDYLISSCQLAIGAALDAEAHPPSLPTRIGHNIKRVFMILFPTERDQSRLRWILLAFLFAIPLRIIGFKIDAIIKLVVEAFKRSG